MAGEVAVPLLPCASIDEVVAFYEVLGFRRTYQQLRPNPYVIVQREDLRLDFFGMPGFDPANSYGTCVVMVPDTGEIFRAFAEGMRAAYGKILVAGIPRMTRPRKRKNVDNISGFSVIDPGGNWIRFFATKPAADEPDDAALSRLGASLKSAVVMGDSKGVEEQAIRILDSALKRYRATATVEDLINVLAYRAELAIRVDDTAAARDYVAQIHDIPLTDEQRTALAEVLSGLNELQAG
ncbi:VOC family protein [Kribbella sp. NPDC056951]|uniref:VOC family protein n=1 Tax=Kribbella sp. NPDC056951 TaxID=3345978 RepID=UPI003628A6A5